MVEEASCGWPSVFAQPTYHVCSTPDRGSSRRKKKMKQECATPVRGVVDRLYVGPRRGLSTSCVLAGHVDDDYNYYYNNPKGLPARSNPGSTPTDSAFYWSDGEFVSLVPRDLPSTSDKDMTSDCNSTLKNASGTGVYILESPYNAEKASTRMSVLDLLTLPSRKRLSHKKGPSSSKGHMKSIRKSRIGTSLPDIQKLACDLKELEVNQLSTFNACHSSKYELSASSNKLYFTQPEKALTPTHNHRPHGAFGTITINPSNPSIPSIQASKRYFNLEVQGNHPHKQFYRPFFNSRR